MGVFGLFSTLREKYSSEFVHKSGSIGIQHLDVAFIDGNAMLYPIAEEVKDPIHIATMFVDTVVEYLNEFGCTLYICMDGAPHMAKVKQQRSRRFNYSPIICREHVQPDYLSSGLTEIKPSLPFSPAMFTPGTEMMNQVNIYIKKEINNRNLNNIVLYSSYLEPYEGEHKIFQILRNIESDNITYAIVGKDADLLLLSMGQAELALTRGVTQIPYIVRHNDKAKKDGYKASDPLYVINMDTLRAKIMGNIPFAKSIWDFIIALFICGNDFLPRVPEFIHLRESLSILMEKMIPIYDVSKKDTGYIDWQQFILYMKSLLEYDYSEAHSLWLPDVNKITIPEFSNIYYKIYHPFQIDTDRISKAWTYTICWNMYYYHDGVEDASIAWQYPLHFAPSLYTISTMIVNMDNVGVVREKLNPLSVRQALVAVLPIWLHSLISADLRAQIYNSDLSLCYPWKFNTLGPKQEPIIPIVDYKSILNIK